MTTENLVYFADNHTTLKYPTGALYNIHIDRIKTPKEILNFVSHLSLKNWVTTEHIYMFIELATNISGINLYK